MMHISDSYRQKNSLFNAMNRFISAVNDMDQMVMVPSLLRDVPLDETGEMKAVQTDMYSSYELLKSIRNDMEWGVLRGGDEHWKEKVSAGVSVVKTDEEHLDEEDLEKQFHYHLDGLQTVLTKLTRKANTLSSRYQEEIGTLCDV